MSNGYKLLLSALLISIICIILFQNHYASETYGMLSSGQKILSDGIYQNEYKTFQTSAATIEPTFVANIILAIAQKYKDQTGVLGITLIFYIISCLIMFFMMRSLCKNSFVSWIFIVPAIILLSLCAVPNYYFAILPLMPIIIGFLEKFIQTENFKFLYPLPLASILIINLSAQTWFYFILILVIYMIDYIKNKVATNGNYRDIKLIKMICTITFSILCGVLNPFGTKSMSAGLINFAYSLNNNFQTFDFKQTLGILVFSTLTIYTISFFTSAKDFRLRFVFLPIISFIIFTLNTDMIFLFAFVFGILGAVLFNYESLLKPLNNYRYLALTALLIIILFSSFKVVNYGIKLDKDLDKPQILGVANFLNSTLNQNSRLFSYPKESDFLEYKGIKTFVDSRLYLVLPKKTLNDYFKLISRKLYYDDFFKRYNITHIAVPVDSLLGIYLQMDSGYTTLYKNDMYIVFCRLKPS